MARPKSEAAGPRVIKKYANRRLYDTHDSRYVTLEEVAGFVRAGAEIVVRDARTEVDLTAAILAQVIADGATAQDHGQVPIDVLRWLVAGMDAAPLIAAGERAASDVVASQRAFADASRKMLSGDPFGAWASLWPAPRSPAVSDDAALRDRIARLEEENAVLRARLDGEEVDS